MWKYCGSLLITIAFLISFAYGQRSTVKTRSAKKSIIFAVVSDGSVVEPIAYLENGKLTETGLGPGPEQTAFAKKYYQSMTKYDLVFGGAPAGSVSIKRASTGECGGSSADVLVTARSAKLKGNVMALATSAAISGRSVRRMPLAAERTELEALVRDAYDAEQVAPAALKQLRYHNLTGINIDGDNDVEFVGSYWISPKPNERGLLFFIADKGTDGKFSLVHKEYSKLTPDDVMSGDLKDLETGIGNVLLLDAMDYDKDGNVEIFTITKAFEGDNFTVYKNNGGKWVKAFETYNYRCAY